MSWPQAAGLQITRNKAKGNRSINIFGRNTSIGITFEPITPGGVLRLPLPADAQRLRIAAGGNAADSAAGAGAQQILISGLNAEGNKAAEIVTTAGATASALTTTAFWRVQEVIVLHIQFTDIVFYAKVSNSTSPCSVSWDGVLTLGIDDVDLNGVTAEDFVLP
jgi:hypothetical protein